MGFKKILVVIGLILVAFGAGYGLGYLKWYTAEREWVAAKGEMQTKIRTLEEELAQAKAREKLRQIPDMLSEVLRHLSEKNFGLAAKAVDGLKEAFLAIQPSLAGELKNRFDFLLPALEEIKKEVEGMSQNARGKTEETKKLFEEALKPPKK